MQLKKYKNIKLEMRRLLVLFIGITLFSAPVFSQKKEVYKVQTVVIDPGHGGAKPGAIGSRTSEKTIVLSIAKKFGKLIADNYPDVKVIYTRTTDVDISLAERAHIANRNKADLFVSVHANSHPTSTPTGVETFVMGLSESRANLEVAKKENADILLEADYKDNEAYKGFDPNAPESFVMLAMYQNAFIDKSLNFAQAIQNQYKKNLKTINRGVKQAELFVLYKTTCPSVLTEVGFISNPAEEAFMMSDEGQAKIAVSLFNAFMNFKATEEGTNKIANPKIDIPGYVDPAKAVVPEPEPVVETPVVDTPAVAVVAPAERPVPKVELAPRMELAPESVAPVVEVPTVEPVAPEPAKAESAPAPQPQPESTLAAPKNTAVSATEYFTVQFLTSSKELLEGDPAFHGIENVISSRNGLLYCYSVGRFSTFTEANEYCKEVQQHTPFKDAWAVRRRINQTSQNTQTAQAAQPVEAKPVEAKPVEAKPVEAKPVETKPVETKPVEAKPVETKPVEAKPAETKPAVNKPTETKPAEPAKPKQIAPEDKGTHYRIQILTASRVIKSGDPDLHGIKDFRHSKNGKYYIYSCGNYKTLAEARKRLASIKATTPFKDAFIFGIKDGRRFNID